jgi:hypothetical protein
MNDLEQRLRSALNARADLVQPEDLSLSPVLEEPGPDAGPWWHRPGAYLFVAAVAVIVIALPLLALAATNLDDPKRPPAEPAISDPTSDETVTDPTPVQVDQDAADVDGDGTDDQIRVVSTEAPDAVIPDFEVTVELSSTGKTVSHAIGPATDLRLGATASVDGRPGEEIVLAHEPETIDLHRAVPIVLSLRGGELASILVDDLGAPGRGDAGTSTYWWVNDGQLWWWRSQEVVARGEQSPFAVDVLEFPREAMLRGVDHGTWCVTNLAATRLKDCDDPKPPTGSTGPGPTNGTDGPDGSDTGGPGTADVDPWWAEAVSGLPSAWGAEGRSADGFPADVNADGDEDDVSLAGGELSVDLGDRQLTATVDGPNPTLEGSVVLDGRAAPVIVGHTTEGAAGTTYVSWFAYAAIGGELVELGTAPLGPAFGSQYSNLTPAEGGHPTLRTWRPDEGALYGMDYLDRAQVEGPAGETVWVYRVRVRSWYVDGALLRATTLGQACTSPAVGNEFTGCPEGL